MNEELFKKELIKHKKIISFLNKEYDKEGLRTIASMGGRELALAYSGCKCQRCKKSINLQCHHIVLNYLKDYMDIGAFHSQRNYWANIIILCRDCHKLLHHLPRNMDFNTQCIDKEKIEEVKTKFQVEEAKQKV